MPLGANANAGSFGEYEGRIYEPIQFFGAATGGTPPYSFNWDFNDGETSDLQNPMHVFENDGTFIVTLTVEDDKGDVATDTAQVTIQKQDELIASAGGPYTGKTHEDIYFTGTATGGIEPYNYVWDFGDGSYQVQKQNPTHRYNEVGTYTVCLKITDHQDIIDTHETEVTILKEKNTVEIINIKGGIGIEATIKAGDEPVEWAISMGGRLVIYSEYNSGTIEADSIKTVKIPFSIGLGKVKITITANEITEERFAFMIGPIVLGI
jgi:PKD repeat protein